MQTEDLPLHQDFKSSPARTHEGHLGFAQVQMFAAI